MDLIIFDLGGTLVDSRQDIAASVNDLLSSMGREQLPPQRVFGFIGNGVRMLLERSLGGSADEQERDYALELFLPIYRSHLLDTTRPYPGGREALEALFPGSKMAVLTNAYESYGNVVLADDVAQPVTLGLSVALTVDIVELRQRD